MKSNITTTYWLIAIPYFIYLVMRATYLPLTHDEAVTVINYVPQDIFKIFANGAEHATPNNHLLNTLGIKFFTWLLPTSALTVRLTALLGGLIYLLATYRLSVLLSADGSMSFMVVASLLLNPFVAEFLALARGYGLACGLMLLSIAEAYRYVKYGHVKAFYWSMPLAALAVLASFTAIYFYLTLFVMLTWVAVERNGFTANLYKQAGYATVISALLGAVSYLPLKVISDPAQMQFWSGEGFFTRTVQTLVKDTIFYNSLFTSKAVHTIGVLSLIFAALWGISSLVKWARAKYRFINSPEAWIFTLFLGTVFTNILNNYLTKTPFLDHRTALVFYPLWALGLPICMHWLGEKRAFLAAVFTGIFLFFFIQNFFRSANIRDSTEWYYDRDTYTVLEYLKNMHITQGKKEPYTLNYTWVYQPSLEFHTNIATNNYKEFVKLSPYHPRDQYDTSYEYFYAEHPDEEKLDSLYTTVLVLEKYQRFLMRKKESK